MIVPMKKAILTALSDDRNALLLSLQKCGEIMIVATTEGLDGSGAAKSADILSQQTETALAKIKNYKEKRGFLAQAVNVEYQQFAQKSEKSEGLKDLILQTIDDMNKLETEKTAVQAKIKQVELWIPLPSPIEELINSRYTIIKTGFVPTRLSMKISASVEELGGKIEFLGESANEKVAYIVCFCEDKDSVLERAKVLGFSETIPPYKSGIASQVYTELQNELKRICDRVDSAEKKMEDLSKRSDEIELLSDQYHAENERNSVPLTQTAETICITGWVRSDRVDKVKKAITIVTDIFDLELLDPAEGELPPTVTKNNKFITQFETITDMFSRPVKGGKDPNSVMGWWYFVIFGLMMGDAGYGLLMAVIFFLFKKYKKPRGETAKLINVLYYSSITTLLWGVVFGSYFGETWNPILFSPLDNPVGMLIFSLVIGVLHIYSGMIMKMIADIKNGNVWDAIFDQLSWMILLTGVGLWLAGMAMPALTTVGMIMAASGAATIVLTAGRKKKGIFSKVSGGLLGLYNITGYMSDILSYSRILALSLATGVIGMVMNMLAGMVQGSVIGFVFSLAIYIVGHLFNLAMGLLSAYVHDSRLQYIEFFNKFYDGGGYAFTPLSINTKYVDIDYNANTNHTLGGK